jgi:hypothetical protein
MGVKPFWLEPRQVVLKDGTVVTLRPEEKEDLEPVWEMFSTLSDESLQYLPIPITRERVEGWFREINYERVLPILGLVEEEGGERVIAASSLDFGQMEHNKHVASFGITVHDDYQNLGLGKKNRVHDRDRKGKRIEEGSSRSGDSQRQSDKCLQALRL